MGHAVGISKTERRKAIIRTKEFIAEFKALPEHKISLNTWFSYPTYVRKEFCENDVYCGSVGCVGGYAAYSPLMEKYT